MAGFLHTKRDITTIKVIMSLFYTASGNRCCNFWNALLQLTRLLTRYKTASGNRCCNSTLGNPCLERLFGDTLANQINVYHDSSEKRLFERLSPTPGSQNPYHARTSWFWQTSAAALPAYPAKANNLEATQSPLAGRLTRFFQTCSPNSSAVIAYYIFIIQHSSSLRQEKKAATCVAALRLSRRVSPCRQEGYPF